jgi:hypothetical protein
MPCQPPPHRGSSHYDAPAQEKAQRNQSLLVISVMSRIPPSLPFDQTASTANIAVPLPGAVRTIGGALNLAFDLNVPLPDDMLALLSAIDAVDPANASKR